MLYNVSWGGYKKQDDCLHGLIVYIVLEIVQYDYMFSKHFTSSLTRNYKESVSVPRFRYTNFIIG